MPNNRSTPLIDPALLGRRLRGARIIAGYDRVADACRAVKQDSDVAISERTLYAIERGEQLPSFEQIAALMMTYDPPGAWSYVHPAMRADLIAFSRSGMK